MHPSERQAGDDVETIEAVPFRGEAAAAAVGVTASGGGARARVRRGGAGGIAALLAVAALGIAFLWWLSGVVPQPVPDPAGSGVTPTASATLPARPEAAAPQRAAAPRLAAGDAAAGADGPFAEALVTRKRREAQDVLLDLLDTRARLVEAGVEQWGKAEFDAALAIAAAADETFKAHDYDAAMAGYRAAATALQALLGSRDERRERALAAARAALAGGPPDAAAASIAAARAVAPDAAELADLERRLAAMPRVLDAMRTAERALRRGEIEQARDAVTAAEQLQSGYAPLAALAADVRGRLRARDYLAAMSEGYAALAQRDEARARRSFEAAARIDPGRGDAAQAIAQLSQQGMLAHITRLEAEAAEAMQAEDYPRALRLYEEALQADATLAFARRGQERARAQAALLDELAAAAAHPERLSDEAAFAAATALYQRAVAATGPGTTQGPRLRAAIDALEQVLEVAATPVSVTLRSDNQTEVVLVRSGPLGRFDSRVLELRPGRYVFAGSRDGHRDVRLEVDVGPGMPPVDVRCTEPI
jgi:hypothetical protein